MSQSNVIDIRKSSAPINKLNPDILYHIFTCVISMAQAQDRSKMKVALAISHVCLHWRKFALGWPTLWKFIDLNSSRENIELFLFRSKDAPLELLYDGNVPVSTSRLNLESYADLILPRLRSLTLKCPLSQLLQVKNVFRTSGLQPFRLRRLKVVLCGTLRDETLPELADLMELDASCLHSLIIHGIDLPRLQFSHNNVLTMFILHSHNPPILSQLLIVLSNCPLLRRLGLVITSPSLKIETPTSPLIINKINFPQLERVVLTMDIPGLSSDLTGFYYLREFCTRIGTMGRLSRFFLDYDDSTRNADPSAILPAPNLFELIPQETFHHFPNQVYLSISMFISTGTVRSFDISSAPESDQSNPPLRLSGSDVPGPLFDCFLSKVIHAMPKIMHLKLGLEALKDLISAGLDFRNAFPCLNTLELSLFHTKAEDFDSLPIIFPKIKKLILDIYRCMSPKLLNTVSPIVEEILELRKCSAENYVELGEVISTLCQRGIVVFNNPI